MRTTTLLLIFLAGFYAAKLDTKYGREYGGAFGTKMRGWIGLPPLEKEKK